MIADQLQAREEINEMLAAAWGAFNWGAAAPAIHWEGREKPSPPPPDQPYVAIFIKHLQGLQASLTDDLSRKRWRREGLITVQCFGSLASGRGLEDAVQMGIIAGRAYEGKQSANCIWFRDVVSKEIGPTGGWYQVNVTVQFEYDEVR